nr:DUF4097 family beta strand repeat protein [Bacilli bacterium]
MKNKVAISLIVILSVCVIILTGGMIYLLNGGSKIKLDFMFGNRNMILVDNYTTEAININKIYLNLNSTDVEINESIDNNVKVEYYSNRDNNAKIEYEEGVLSVNEEKYDTSCIGICNTRRKVIVSVPSDYKTNYEVKLKSGDLKSNIDLSGNNMAVSTMSGDVKLNKVSDISISAMSGDIIVDDIVGTISFSTMSGDVRIRNFNITSNSTVSTMSGDVKINYLSGSYVESSTKSGDIKINNNDRKSDIVLKINTSSGDISIN